MELLIVVPSSRSLIKKSATEAELFGTSDYVPFNIWIVMFYGEQGYEITKNVIFKIMKAQLRQRKNWQESCTGNSRYINIRQFCVKDKVDEKEIEVQFCSTHLMMADYFTKPLQGNLIKSICNIIMGYKHIGDSLEDTESTTNEHVGNQNKVTENSNMKNNNKRTIQVQVQHIESSRTI